MKIKQQYLHVQMLGLLNNFGQDRQDIIPGELCSHLRIGGKSGQIVKEVDPFLGGRAFFADWQPITDSLDVLG